MFESKQRIRWRLIAVVHLWTLIRSLRERKTFYQNTHHQSHNCPFFFCPLQNFFFRRVNYLQTARRINDWGKKQQTFREPTAFVLSLFVPSSLPLRHIFNFHSNPSLLECADRTVIIFPFVQRLEDIGVVRKLFGQNYKEKPSFPCSNLWPSLVRTHL